MKHGLPLFLLSAIVFVGCDSKSLPDDDRQYKPGGGVRVKVYKVKDSFIAFSTENKPLEATSNTDWPSHSLEDFICLQRLEQLKETLETIRSLEEQIKSSDAASPRTRELRKEIFETRTQLLGILSDIEDAKFILVP
jgi:hypothetical protein